MHCFPFHDAIETIALSHAVVTILFYLSLFLSSFDVFCCFFFVFKFLCRLFIATNIKKKHSQTNNLLCMMLFNLSMNCIMAVSILFLKLKECRFSALHYYYQSTILRFYTVVFFLDFVFYFKIHFLIFLQQKKF